MVRGVKVWQILPVAVQKAMTKRKFELLKNKSVDYNDWPVMDSVINPIAHLITLLIYTFS